MIKLSASSMDTYKKCPKKYYYRYINKPDIPEVEWPHLEFGTVSHRALELFHDHIIKNVVEPEEWPKLMKVCVNIALKESKERNKYYLIANNLDEVRKILQGYLIRLKKFGLPPVFATELEFSFEINKLIVRGFIDRVDKYENGVYHVVDYKTSKSGDYLTDFQLALYALALKEKYDDVKEISGSYVLLKQNSDLKTFEFPEDAQQKTINKITEIGQNIDTETLWKKNPSPLCNWCDYNAICQNNWLGE